MDYPFGDILRGFAEASPLPAHVDVFFKFAYAYLFSSLVGCSDCWVVEYLTPCGRRIALITLNKTIFFFTS